ncbi:NCOA1 protein, partial [Pheucticus melanocephalus]|nr:NCOA1 protein [Pheucticus melanocephalus]
RGGAGMWAEFPGGVTAMPAFPGLGQQSDPSGFAAPAALSPGSPLVSPQLPPAPPAPGYQSPELKPWQNVGNVGSNGVFGPAGAAAAPAAAQGMYNNMSITVSMAGSGPGSGIPGSGIPGSGIPGSGVPGSGVPGSGGVPGGSGGVPGMGAMGGGIPMNPVMAGINSMCSEQV